jgi:hypothetical protein
VLTQAQLKARENRLTASVAPVVMGDDQSKLTERWKVAIGAMPEPDLSDVWAVQWGSHGETFTLDWHERKTGQPLTERGTFCPHPTLPYIGCTLDAYRAFDDCVLDCKVSSSFNPLDDIIEYYTPQIIVQMRCRQAARGALLVVHGTAAPRELEIKADPEYEKELWERMAAFWLCVETLTPPMALPKAIPPSQWRKIVLDPDNEGVWPNWGQDMAACLRVWKFTKAHAEMYAEANKELRDIIPDDVGLIEFENMRVIRNRAGSITVKRG